MHEVLVNRLGGLSLPRKSVVRLTDRPDMTLDVYRDVKQQYNNNDNNMFRRKCRGRRPSAGHIEMGVRFGELPRMVDVSEETGFSLNETKLNNLLAVLFYYFRLFQANLSI